MPPAKLLPALLPGLLWLWTWMHLRDEWTLNAQYNYGWAVPFLAAYLFYLRWQSRPDPPAVALASRGPLLLQGFLLLPLLPLRLLQEANRDWRFLGWALALVAVLTSFLAIWRAGGLTWVRHFAFPICFPLVAVPWPVRWENFVVQALARAVAGIAVEIAGWIGIGAYRLGNVIELPNGFVGVDDACSGVKTLQATIMVTLFLGEVLRMQPARRLVLFAAGCTCVFLCNVGRATTLVILSANHGADAVSRWHNLVGTIVLLAGMIGVLALAFFLARKEQAPSPSGSPTRAGAFSPRPIESAIAVAWILFVFGVTEFWYRAHERELISRPEWSARWPGESINFRVLEIPESTRAILHYDTATSASWEDPAGVRWWGFFGRWKPQRAALQLVRSHSPEICLPAVGRTFKRELAPISVNANNIELRFRVYEFIQNERPLFVFVAIQEDKARANAPENAELSAAGRLRATLNGQRNLGQRLLEIAVFGYHDFPQAREALRQAALEIVG